MPDVLVEGRIPVIDPDSVRLLRDWDKAFGAYVAGTGPDPGPAPALASSGSEIVDMVVDEARLSAINDGRRALGAEPLQGHPVGAP